ncbi:hypothetical protein [Flavobacterium gelatinilyticum]|uniref:hypothetical protein n=1 Tax=Flavobacterium gelatinilyticum TaxID=3003260 RepID=UPI0024810AB5|nr:hypothetical protein [Flavobacterium gelatinilyticum]
MKRQKIEDIFSSMENYSSVPPPELWSQIEEKLDKPKKKKRAILWWSAAACLLLGLTIPSVLHFSSDTNIQNLNKNVPAANSVAEENNPEKTEKTRSLVPKTEKNQNQISSSETTINPSHNTQSNSIRVKTAVEQNSENKENNSVYKSKTDNEKAPASQYAVSNTKLVPARENTANSASKSTILHDKKGISNQYNAQNSFASFNPGSKNIVSDKERKNADKILAEKTFTSKQNGFNTTEKNQVSNSVFENLSPSKNNSVAFNSSNSVSNKNLNSAELNHTAKKQENQFQNKNTAENAKSGGKANLAATENVLSKKDSLQLLELQNLEKGIAGTEDKKDKEEKASQKDKWALQVFAGVANSENYKNNKTLGNVNDSRQSNSYGVKTQYKINKKWAVGSGLKINELGQTVANVSYVSARNQVLFSATDQYMQNPVTPQVATSSNFMLISESTKEALKSENIQTGSLDQNLRYIEMPLEVSYSIFNRNKASINLNTGAFVGKLISNNAIIDGNPIGENMNANEYVYGSTLSSTLQYRVYKKTNVFVEPAVNYYANPLTNQSFNQFQWGFNFGLNVNF